MVHCFSYFSFCLLAENTTAFVAVSAPSEMAVEENEATDVTKNIKHRKMKGTRVLRIVGNEMIGRPWTEATAEMSLGIRAIPIITDHSATFSYQYQY